MKKTVTCLLLSLALSACAIATHKELSATGGSKADGIIELSFEHTEAEKPTYDESKNLAMAKQRCNAWGYAEAEAFGGVKRQCNQMGGWSGCARYLVTKQYQCTN